MKTLKISLALVLLSGIQTFAQSTKKIEQIALNQNISVVEAARVHPAKKINPLYQQSIQRTQFAVLDVDNSETASLKTANSNTPVAEIKAFPNPFTTQIDVIITDGAMGKSVYKANLYDMNGKRVFSETLTANQSSLLLSQLSAGMYVLHIEKNGSIIKQEKFIKE